MGGNSSTAENPEVTQWNEDFAALQTYLDSGRNLYLHDEIENWMDKYEIIWLDTHFGDFLHEKIFFKWTSPLLAHKRANINNELLKAEKELAKIKRDGYRQQLSKETKKDERA